MHAIGMGIDITVNDQRTATYYQLYLSTAHFVSVYSYTVCNFKIRRKKFQQKSSFGSWTVNGVSLFYESNGSSNLPVKYS